MCNGSSSDCFRRPSQQSRNSHMRNSPQQLKNRDATAKNKRAIAPRNTQQSLKEGLLRSRAILSVSPAPHPFGLALAYGPPNRASLRPRMSLRRILPPPHGVEFAANLATFKKIHGRNPRSSRAKRISDLARPARAAIGPARANGVRELKRC